MAENEFEVSGDREFDWSPALRTVSAEGYDPYSQFSKFATSFRPSERQALNKLYESLSGRYALGGVGVPAFQGYGLGGQAIDPRQHEDFRSYLTGYDPSGSNRMSFNNMLSRAQRARDIGKLSSIEFEDLYGGLESSDDKRSASWARYMYETSPDAAQNQMKLAQLLALQRPDAAGGRGEYGGIMRSAISSAMDELYNARIAQDKSPNRFLDWYLSITGRRGDQVLPEGLGGEDLVDPSFVAGSTPTTPIPTTSVDSYVPVPTNDMVRISNLVKNPNVVGSYGENLADPMFGAGNTTTNAPAGPWNDFMQEDTSLSMFTNDAFKKWAVNKGINLGMLNRDEANDAWNMFTREQPLSIPRFNYNVTQTPTATPTQTPINSTLPSAVNSTLPSLTTSPTPTPTPTPFQYEDPLLRDQLANIPNAGLDYGLSNVMPNTVIPNTYQHVPYTGMNFQDWQLNDTIQNLVIPNMSTETPMEKIRRLQKEEDIYRMGGGM
tara:strand:- start:1200 stop:2678 length:1479 start_codon:yes stop_codon:yes gene_type:complete